MRESGRLPAVVKTRAATQRDVAGLAGVDRATVSRALDPRRRHLLAQDTVQRVLDAADALRYRPNTLARGLRTQRSGIVCLSVPQLVMEQATGFIAGAEDQLRRGGLALLMAFDTDAALLSDSNGLIDGTIALTAETPSADAAAFPGPLVRVGFDPRLGTDVTIDHRRGIGIAVEHLYRLGHRRIAIICEPESTAAGQRNRASFAEAVSALQDEIQPSVATFQPSRPSSAWEAGQSLLKRRGGPTGIVVADDAAAAGCYGAARTLALRIPEDVSIVGYGDSAAAPYLLPPLTTISVPARAAGRRAAAALLERLAGRSAPPVTLTPHLVQRGSTAPPAG